MSPHQMRTQFPPLASLSDAECRRVLRLVRRRYARSETLVGVATAVLASLVFVLTLRLGLTLADVVETGPARFQGVLAAGFFVAASLAICLAAEVSVRWTRHHVRRHLQDAVCFSCAYSLEGLEPAADRRLTCPECGVEELALNP